MEEMWFFGQAAFETAFHLISPLPHCCKVMEDTPGRLVIECRLPPGGRASSRAWSVRNTSCRGPAGDWRWSPEGDAVHELIAGVPFTWPAAYVHSAKNTSEHEVVFEITINKS
jgi:hypothetical protein